MTLSLAAAITLARRAAHAAAEQADDRPARVALAQALRRIADQLEPGTRAATDAAPKGTERLWRQ